MSIAFQILGPPGRDNALLVRIDGGQAIERLLFDCGEGCLSELPVSEVMRIDHLCFSHLHMDHVAGFDRFFRCNYDRDSKPNRIWGPPETARIMHGRFQGYLWNLHKTMSGSWLVSDIHPDETRTKRFELREAFAVAHDERTEIHHGVFCEGAGFTAEAWLMDHMTPSVAYLVRECARQNVDEARLAAMALKPGPWLNELKNPSPGASEVVVDGITHSLDELRSALIVETPGESIAYLTDFLLDGAALDWLSDRLRGCRTIVCECQYRHADRDLASKNYHMTTTLSATLAKQAGAGELVLMHLSDRYERGDWAEMLKEAREVFPDTRFPAHWALGDEAAIQEDIP